MSPTSGQDDERRFWRALRRGERTPPAPAATERDREASEDRRPDAAETPSGAPLVERDGETGEATAGPDAVAPEREAGSDGDADPASPPSRARTAEGSEARRAALRSMLDAAEARVTRASRARRPVLASGAVVRVIRGELAGCTGVVVDADYIESRVLLSIDPAEPPCWVPFRRVGPAETGD